ncbi:MAG: hypothetical protein J5I93_07280 [Pirellulaceae bacterium]|nr:hypothetical protein [Pirellulaceae bacterium]
MNSRPIWLCLCWLAAVACRVPAARAVEAPRSETHQKFAEQLWEYVQRQSYAKWTPAKADPAFAFGPPTAACRHFLNTLAAGDLQATGAVVVTEHLDAEGQVVGVTVWRKNDAGYHPPSQDWYWAHYLPSGTVVMTCADRSPGSQRGFVLLEEDGRLWVFRLSSPDLGEFLQAGELAKCVVRPGAGPGGVTLKAPDAETLDDYVRALGR